MSYSQKIIRKSEQITSLWSGGKTTQLAIYPEDGDYSKRDFKWRISTADVEVDESLFTHLPGIQRIIMILDGEMMLEHKGKHRVHLQPFEQDRFDGGWTTRSIGRVTDFNLMLAEGCEGDLRTIHLTDGIHSEVLDYGESTKRTNAYYCFKGKSRMSIDEKESIVLGQGDLVILNMDHFCNNIKLSNYEDHVSSTIIKVSIFY
ncbi:MULTISPECIES: HutD/Ves family protein [Peribacillus]|uniref:HutD/Ves family protein n=1 Tax=Peribacillus TaxID=2675229 RepID=UPI001F4DA40B|nr:MULTISPECIES: HutD family protein [unclassified Peribacillus]MCK1983578.1 HutD family protein [Peribacillus sp. Aquil_B1]MCK2006596.1 HutD family protein [Peribacillus sp. Aquil_B8]